MSGRRGRHWPAPTVSASSGETKVKRWSASVCHEEAHRTPAPAPGARVAGNRTGGSERGAGDGAAAPRPASLARLGSRLGSGGRRSRRLLRPDDEQVDRPLAGLDAGDTGRPLAAVHEDQPLDDPLRASPPRSACRSRRRRRQDRRSRRRRRAPCRRGQAPRRGNRGRRSCRRAARRAPPPIPPARSPRRARARRSFRRRD